MKKLLALLTVTPFVLTSCTLILEEDDIKDPVDPDTTDPDTTDPDTTDPVVPEEPAPEPELPDFEPVDPAVPNAAPTFGNTEVTIGIFTDLATVDWVSLLGITDDTSTAAEITVVDEGLDFVQGVEAVESIRLTAYDKNGDSTRSFIEVTYEGLGLSDDEIFKAANEMSFQITTTNGTSSFYGSGYALSMDHSTGDMYVMTNMHVVSDSSFTALLTHDYQKVGTFLPNLCAEHEFSLPSRHNSAHWTDLSILKVTGESSNGLLNGCSNPVPTTIDTSLVQFPNLLDIDNMALGGYYGYPYNSGFNNEDINIFLSGFPAAGWDGTVFNGTDTVPTLINRKEPVKTTLYYPSLGQDYSSWDPSSEISDNFRRYENSVIRVPGLNVTGGASGSIMLDRNLNVLGTLNAHNSTDQLSTMIAADEMRYFIDQYCSDATNALIEMCK